MTSFVFCTVSKGRKGFVTILESKKSLIRACKCNLDGMVMVIKESNVINGRKIICGKGIE